MSRSDITVLFLPSGWDDFISSLKAVGVQAQCPRLLTCADERPPTKTLQDDVKVIHDAAKELITSGRKIIVLAHSYGGVVACEAITPSLYASDPVNGGCGVIHVMFVSAWLILPSSSMQAILEQYGLQSRLKLGFIDDCTATADNAPDSFFNDIESRSHAEDLAKQNATQNWSVVGTR